MSLFLLWQFLRCSWDSHLHFSKPRLRAQGAVRLCALDFSTVPWFWGPEGILYGTRVSVCLLSVLMSDVRMTIFLSSEAIKTKRLAAASSYQIGFMVSCVSLGSLTVLTLHFYFSSPPDSVHIGVFCSSIKEQPSFSVSIELHSTAGDIISYGMHVPFDDRPLDFFFHLASPSAPTFCRLVSSVIGDHSVYGN